MFKATHHATRVATVLGVLLIGLGLAAPAFGQLTLDQFAPAHGATNADTLATITLTFSAPLDTTAAFEVSGGFFLGAELSPQPGEPDSITVSNDNRTVAIALTLEDDTAYSLLLTGALSATGEPLDRPYAFTFTTGAALPTGSVSGAVDFEEGETFGALVGLLPETFFAEDADPDGPGGPAFLAVTVITADAGAYTIDFVPPGRYLLGALKDVDQDSEPTLDVDGEGIGFYDDDANRVPDALDVQDGEAVDDKDFPILPITTTTARANIPDAEALALSMQADAALTALQGADLSPEGEAASWFYIFYAPGAADTLAVATLSQFIIPAPFQGGGDGEDDPGDLTDPLPDEWIDSDAAMATAENIGGADFRAQHPDAVVTAGLFNTEFIGFGDEALARNGWPQDLRLLERHLKTAGVAEPVPLWLVFYFPFEGFEGGGSELDFLVIALDAQTGEIVAALGLATTASFSLNAATQEALTWQADATLVAVTNPSHVASLDAGGKTTAWLYVYYSPSTNTALQLVTTGGVVISDSIEETDPNQLPSLDPLPESWIDSDAAAAEAEPHSNDFRNQHADAVVSASLSRGYRPSAPDRAVWRFTYFSQQDAAVLEVDVDANSGLVIVGAEDEAEAPEAIALHQNYPNPFNPETTITYTVNRVGEVALAVYNVLGQKVRTLADGVLQAPGIYTVTWNGTDDAGRPAASGLYVYTLRAGETVKARVMTLLR